jgi:hypothetical protein
LLQSFHALMLRFQAVSDILPHEPDDAKDLLDTAIDRAAEALTEKPSCRSETSGPIRWAARFASFRVSFRPACKDQKQFRCVTRSASLRQAVDDHTR